MTPRQTVAPLEPGRLRPIGFDVLTTLFWGAAVYGFYTYLGTELRRSHPVSTGFAAAAFVAYGLGATAGSLLGGRLADLWGAVRVSTSSLVALAILLAWSALSFQTGWGILPSVFGLSFAGYAFFPAFQARLAARFAQHRATAMAWNNTALYIGITGGAIMGGQVMHRSFEAVCIVSAVIALMGAILGVHRFKTAGTAD
jgi:predicted MFS family arabinose efflux permease